MWSRAATVETLRSSPLCPCRFNAILMFILGKLMLFCNCFSFVVFPRIPLCFGTIWILMLIR